RGVTVNTIAPGFIETAMTDALTDKQKDLILARVPAGRLGSPEDVAAAVLYLASLEGAYVTGQTLHVNGGMAMMLWAGKGKYPAQGRMSGTFHDASQAN